MGFLSVFLNGNEINYLGFLLLLSKNGFLLRKRDHDFEKGENVDENGLYVKNSIFLTNQLSSLRSGPNRSQRNALSLFE